MLQVYSSLGDQTISGPVVDEIISENQRLHSAQFGTEDVQNNYGYNNTDVHNSKVSELLNYSPGSEVPLSLVYQVAQLQLKYRARQSPRAGERFEELRKQIQTMNQSNTGSDNKVKILDKSYGRIKLFIPNGDAKITNGKRALNSLLRDKAQQLGYSEIPISIDTPRGPVTKYDYDLRDYVRKDNNEIDVWAFKPEFLSAARDFFVLVNTNEQKLAKKENRTPFIYDLSELESFISNPPTQQITQPAAPVNKPKVKARADRNQWGPTFVISFPYDRSVVDGFKQVTDSVGSWRKFDGGTKEWILSKIDASKLAPIATFFDSKGYDSSEIQTLISSAPASTEAQPGLKQQKTEKGYVLEVEDVSATTPWLLKLYNPIDKGLQAIFSEVLKFSFPVYDMKNQGNGNRYTDSTAAGRWPTYVNGDYSDLVEFARLLTKYGFDVEPLRAIFKNLVVTKKIKPEPINGELKEDPEAFKKEAEQSVINPEHQLFELQKEDTKFLFSRKSAFLGSETGTGKTLTSLVAAKMKLQRTGGKAVIITLKAVQLQWVRTLQKDLGEEDIYYPNTAKDFDPGKLKKWNILTYPMFSMPKPRNAGPHDKSVSDHIVEALSQSGIVLCILDECHSVKNESARTTRINNMGDSIPYRWGASATISANRPIDVWRQLKAIGHRLGNLSESQFRKNFAGQQVLMGRFGPQWVPISPTSEDEAALKLRRWLTEEANIYVRRTKREMNPNLPSHIVMDNPVQPPEALVKKLNADIAKRMSSYKDPDLAVSEMIATRLEIARAKVPYTLELAENIFVKDSGTGKNGKVLIFTCFQDAAYELLAGAEKICDKYGANAVAILGGDKEREAKVQAFKTDPKTRILVLSILAGGTGLDVPNVTEEVLINDYSWTPKDAEQSEGRAFRVNSKSDVTTRYVLLANTADEGFFGLVRRKKELAAKIDHPTNAEELHKDRMEYKKLDQQMMLLAQNMAKQAKAVNWLQKIS